MAGGCCSEMSSSSTCCEAELNHTSTTFRYEMYSDIWVGELTPNGFS